MAIIKTTKNTKLGKSCSPKIHKECKDWFIKHYTKKEIKSYSQISCMCGKVLLTNKDK